MNRLWTEERIEELSISPTIGEDPSDDHSEQRELFVLLHNYFQLSHSDIFVIDLHTTSAPSAPFTIVLDSLKNRKLAQYLPVPMVLGMEEHLSGTLMHYIDELGYHTMAFESGQHDDPQSIQNHIAAIWILLNGIGCLKKEDIEGYDEAYEQLKNTARDIAPIFEVRYRYGIMPREKFQMYPGFRNFHPVRKGQPLARNQHGEIYCKETGNIFMPLYQPQGSDGFFIIRRIHPFWIRISQWLRKHRADRLLPLLPGIKRDPNQPEMLIINRKVARWFVVEVLHLLGYRQKSYEPHKLIAVKRKYDLTSSCHQ
ncbi:MAG: aspartoacylase [Methanobacteriota archaeon]|nr:MAG: aspartoacylase [Euryarchaeota archaeon]